MTHHTQPRRRWVGRLALGVALFVLAIVLLVTFVPLGGSIKLQAAKLESSNHTGISSSSSQSSPARIDLRTLGVVNLSHHPLMQRVAAGVVEQMQASTAAGIEQVVLIEGDTWALDDGRPCSLLVVLDMPEHEETGMGPTGRKLQAIVTADVGQQVWDSSHGYHDHLTPPIVTFDAHLRLDHTSTTTGFESADARGSLAAANIAEQVSSQVLKKLGEIAAANRVMPELPAAFYGSRFKPSHQLPLPDSPKLRRVYSGPRLMVHNETLWTMPLGDRQPLDILQPMFDQLTADGWRATVELSTKYHQTPYFRLSRGPDVVEAYTPRNRVDNGDGNARPQRLVILLRERFSADEISAAAQQLLDARAPLSSLTMFERQMSPPQRKTMAQRIIDEGAADPELLLLVARHHEGEGRPDAALATLNRAALLTVAHANASNLRKRIEEAGRDIAGDEKWKPAEPDEAMLQAAGFKPVPESGEVSADVALSEPANFYLPGQDLIYHSITVDPTSIPQGVYTLTYRTGRIASSGGSASQSTQHNPQRPWHGRTSFTSDGRTWRVEALELPDNQFRITLAHEAR